MKDQKAPFGTLNNQRKLVFNLLIYRADMNLEALQNTRMLVKNRISKNSTLQFMCEDFFGHIPIPSVSFLGAYDAGHSSLFKHLLVHPNAFPSVSSHTCHFSSVLNSSQTLAQYRINQLFYFAEILERKELIVSEKSIVKIMSIVRELLQKAREVQNKGLLAHLPLAGNIVAVDQDSSLENVIPEILQKFNRNVLLVLVLRDPVERLISHYNRVRKRLGEPDQPLEDLIDIDYLRPFALRGTIDANNEEFYRNLAKTYFNNFVYRGMYVTQLKELLKVFPLEQFFIVSNIELRNNTSGVLKRLFKILCLPDIELPEEEFFIQPSPADRQPVKAETKEILIDFYRPYNEELFKVIGKNLF